MNVGTIVKVKLEVPGLETYTLADGTTWTDAQGKWKLGDKVAVKRFIVGTVVVERVHDKA